MIVSPKIRKFQIWSTPMGTSIELRCFYKGDIIRTYFTLSMLKWYDLLYYLDRPHIISYIMSSLIKGILSKALEINGEGHKYALDKENFQEQNKDKIEELSNMINTYLDNYKNSLIEYKD